MKKKILSLLGVSMVAVSLMAQLPQRVEGNPEQRNEELLRVTPLSVGERAANTQWPENVQMMDTRSRRATEKSKMSLTSVTYPTYKTPSSELKAFYWKPEGTYFIGIDQTLTNVLAGIVGSWLNVEEWVFQGGSSNYSDIEYETYIASLMKEYYYTDPATGNWHDSIVAVYRGAVNSWYSYDMPLLTVTNGDESDAFALCAESTDNSIVDEGVAATIAGVLYPNRTDYMWPLTNAMSVDCKEGSLIMEGINPEDSAQYMLGTTPVTVDSEEGPVTVTPDGFVISYEAPQSTLYVKDISLWLDSYDENYKVANPVIGDNDTLYLTIEDEAGAVLFSTTATKDNLSTTTGKKGGLLTFYLKGYETEYGELVSEGVVLDEAFKVRVTGISKCEGDFSVVTAYAPYGSNTVMILDDGTLKQYAALEPFLMLNGIFPTVYDAYINVEDTLQIITMEMGDGTISNVAAFDETQQAAGYVPAIMSYFYPIDTLKQVTNISFQGPEWITWGFDDSDWAGETYTDMIYLYFFADELPEGVDFREGTITLSSFGKTKTYYVYQGEKPVEQQIGDGTTDLEESNVQPVKVYSLNGQFNLTYPDVYNAVEVYAVNGNKIASYSLPENGSFSIDNSSLANGVYLIRMIGETSEVLKVVK